MKHEPIFYVYQDGDRFFAALPEFVNLQKSEVVWLEQIGIRTLYQKLRDINHLGRKRAVETVDRWGQKTIQEKEA